MITWPAPLSLRDFFKGIMFVGLIFIVMLFFAWVHLEKEKSQQYPPRNCYVEWGDDEVVEYVYCEYEDGTILDGMVSCADGKAHLVSRRVIEVRIGEYQ